MLLPLLYPDMLPLKADTVNLSIRYLEKLMKLTILTKGFDSSLKRSAYVI